MNICVFCSSAEGLAESYRGAARSLGEAIGACGHGLVFGGYDDGLMGEVARAAKGAGARIVGVLPAADGDLPGRVAFPCDELVETDGLSPRKAMMERIADAFVALPGSYGTLDELYDVLAAGKLSGTGAPARPVGLLDVDGFFEPLESLHRRMAADGFMSAAMLDTYRTFTSAGKLMEYLESAVR